MFSAELFSFHQWQRPYERDGYNSSYWENPFPRQHQITQFYKYRKCAAYCLDYRKFSHFMRRILFHFDGLSNHNWSCVMEFFEGVQDSMDYLMPQPYVPVYPSSVQIVPIITRMFSSDIFLVMNKAVESRVWRPMICLKQNSVAVMCWCIPKFTCPESMVAEHCKISGTRVEFAY